MLHQHNCNNIECIVLRHLQDRRQHLQSRQILFFRPMVKCTHNSIKEMLNMITEKSMIK